MSDENIQTKTSKCSACSKPLVKDASFCAFCGAQVVPPSPAPAIDAYIQKTIDSKLASRLKTETSLVRELADKVEDIVWKRYTRYVIILALLIAVLGASFTFFGVTTSKDVSAKIDPIVQAAVRRAEAAKDTVEKSAAKVDALKAPMGTPQEREIYVR